MMHPHTELRFVDDKIGYGVFATKMIPKGTITWVLDKLDQQLDESYVLSVEPILRERLLKYCYRNNEGKYILCWDIGKYVNHSFNSSCVGTVYKFELAVRDIHVGEELTDDYGYFNLDKPFHCLAEPGHARIKVMPDDLLHYYHEWDSKAIESMKFFNRVEQPLIGLVDPALLDKVKAVAEGKKMIDSILHFYYDRTSRGAAAKSGTLIGV